MKKLLMVNLLFVALVSLAFAFSPKFSTVMADTSDPTQAPPKDSDFDAFNPLKIFNKSAAEKYYANPDELDTPAGIMSRALLFAFPIAGLVLFVMLIWGGFEMLSGAATKKSLDAGRQRITAALVGFLLLFASYWIAQIIEVIFGVVIL